MFNVIQIMGDMLEEALVNRRCRRVIKGHEYIIRAKWLSLKGRKKRIYRVWWVDGRRVSAEEARSLLNDLLNETPNDKKGEP